MFTVTDRPGIVYRPGSQSLAVVGVVFQAKAWDEPQFYPRNLKTTVFSHKDKFHSHRGCTYINIVLRLCVLANIFVLSVIKT